MAIGVAVCIITYRRPQGLAKLLAALARQSEVPARDLLVVVVDNDPERSAHAVVKDAQAGGLAIDYDQEPVPGIPRARNRSVAIALERGAQHLAFLDDDETPAETWLARLLDHARAARAPVVTGPVLSVLPDGVPQWIERARVFSRPRFASGHRLDRAATNNVLVDRAVFENMELWFDESRPLTGGTDTDFFRRAHLAGFAIEWCDQAVVYEEVPPERCNLRWIGRRTLRGGLVFARLSSAYAGSAAVARNLAVGGLRFAFGLAVAVLTLGIVPRLRLLAIENFALGAGLLLGSFGVTVQEYRRRGGAAGGGSADSPG
jgi:succinoglycan biosynthesis protein ExoM